MATELHLVSKTGMFQEMESRQHRMTADEPENNHGTDKGPAPYELLLASLAACSSATLRMYAGRKGFELGTITADLKFKRDADGNEKIERVISFSENISEERMERIRDIIEKTPVTKTLKRGTPIVTRFE
ncbi:OsmC family protein [Parvibaculum sp.]|uniref:OsmC family protein n=1 Tax=Parvibaculum sp. TaxID=2024848 RepID=UPI003299C21E